MFHTSFSKAFKKQALYVTMLGAVIVPLSACDLTKNHLKADRSTDMEIQDYRDALAPRLPDVSEDGAGAGIPELKPYMATPSDKMKAMPLVSVSVNQTVPLKDILYELGKQAGYDIELDPRIRGSIIFTATNKPFDQVVDKISTSAGLRYKFDDDSVKIELDTPYSEIYKINYLNYVRSNTSSISNDVAVVSGEGADTGSKFKAEAKSESDFWKELDTNLNQILGSNREAGTLRTSRDPRISAVSEQAAPVSPVAPVEPVILTADGEIAQNGGTNVQVQAPDAILRIEPLPVDEDEAPRSGTEDPFAARYSMNKQAGIISVFATERLQKQIGKYLDVLKKSVSSQVLIEAKVLEVSLTDEFSAGIDWSRLSTGNGLRIGSISSASGVAPPFDPVSSPTIGFFASYLATDFQSTVQAISRFGTVHALASPRLTVLNNQSAVLNVATNVVYFELDVDVTTVDGSSSTTVDSQIRNVPEGILINVQPSIDLDSETISMAVRPTVTRIERFVNDPGVSFLQVPGIESPVPVVNVQEFDSVIKMNNGRPVILGGLIQDRVASEQTGIPVLSEVPLVGALFRNQGDKIQKTELVVILKATIVEGDNTIHNTDRDMYRTFSQDRRPFDL